MSQEIIPHEEVDTVKKKKVGLLFLSLLILSFIVLLVAMPFSENLEAIAQLLSSDDKYLAVFGNMHPLILHLPIGIVFLTLTLEVLGWISFGKYRPATTAALFLGIVTGVLACVTGFVDMHTDGYAGKEVWNNHMWAGIAFVSILGLAYLSRLWSGSKLSKNPIYAVLLLVAAGVMGFGAHIGGEEIHGPTGVEALVNELRGIEEEPEKVTEEPQAIKAPKDRLAYADVIVPILKDKCLACHAVDTKKKGGLLMDSWEALLAGGNSAPELMTLVPGDVKKSYMIEVIHLPLDDEDDMHMPPKKKPQLEAHEIALLDWWVGALPKSDQLEDKTLTEMGAPPEIIEAASKLASEEELAAIAAKKDAEKAAAKVAVDPAKDEQAEKISKALAELKKNQKLKNAIKPISQGSPDLEFTAVSLRESLTDEHFNQLEPVAEAITSLQLGSTSVSEAALEVQLSRMPRLTKLNLSQTSITDKGLDAIAKLADLEWLNLYGTAVTDAGLMKLKNMEQLKKVYLWGSKVTPEGVEALNKENPQIEVDLGLQ